MIYLFIILVLFYLSFKYDGHTTGLTNKQNQGVYGIVFLFIILAGFSKNIGGDVYVTYWPQFAKSPTIVNLSLEKILDPESLQATNYNYKPFYILTRAIVRSLTSEFWVYHILHAIFINTIIFIFLKKRTLYLCLSLLYYFIINYFEYNTEIIRESLAVAMGFLAFNQLEKKKYFLYLVFAFCAFMFHSSGLIVLLMPVGIILGKTPQKYIFIFLCALAIIMPIVYEKTDFGTVMSLMGEAEQKQSFRLVQTIEKNYNLNFYLIHYFKFLILPGILIYFSQKQYKFNYLGLVMLYLLFRIMGIYGDMFYRFGNYFAPFFWMFMAKASYSVSSQFSNRYRILTIVSIFILFFSLNFIGLLSKDDSGLGVYIYQRYYPYKSIMF